MAIQDVGNLKESKPVTVPLLGDHPAEQPAEKLRTSRHTGAELQLRPDLKLLRKLMTCQ